MDHDPRSSREPEPTRAESVARYRAAVLRDLEWLLNTRRTIRTADADRPEVRSSVYHYGVPDVTSLSPDSTDSRQFLLRQVEEAVRLFEPRLADVVVELGASDDGASKRRAVRLRVEATLLMEPDPERIVFDTVLETSSGAFSVKE